MSQNNMDDFMFRFDSWWNALPKGCMEVYRCYNKKSLRTMGIYKSMECALSTTAKIENQKDIIPDFYETEKVYIKKIKLYGCTPSSCFLIEEIFIPRFPEGYAFITEEKAYEVGFKYILEEYGYKYMWKKNQCISANTSLGNILANCDREWVKKVLENVPIAKDHHFFSELEGKMPQVKTKEIWKKLWEARILENDWRMENSMEEVYNIHLQ